jgi:hypothetical protein
MIGETECSVTTTRGHNTKPLSTQYTTKPKRGVDFDTFSNTFPTLFFDPLVIQNLLDTEVSKFRSLNQEACTIVNNFSSQAVLLHERQVFKLTSSSI